MGTFSAEIEIGTPDGSRYEPVTALVDTGASVTTLPGSVLEELGVVPHKEFAFVLADGGEIQRPVGRTWIRIGERSEITLVVFADDDVEPLPGAYSLQGLMLGVDSPNERLVPVNAPMKQGRLACSREPLNNSASFRCPPESINDRRRSQVRKTAVTPILAFPRRGGRDLFRGSQGNWVTQW